MKNSSDYLIAGVIFIIVIYLFYKTRDNYKKIVSGKKDAYAVSERSFFIKGVLFTVLPIAMAKSAFESFEASIIFLIIFLLGLWNILHAFLLMRYNQSKSESKKS